MRPITDAAACCGLAATEHLDALALERALFLEVLFDCLVNLRSHDVVAGAADFLSQLQEATLIELDVLRSIFCTM